MTVLRHPFPCSTCGGSGEVPTPDMATDEACPCCFGRRVHESVCPAEPDAAERLQRLAADRREVESSAIRARLARRAL